MAYLTFTDLEGKPIAINADEITCVIPHNEITEICGGQIERFDDQRVYMNTLALVLEPVNKIQAGLEAAKPCISLAEYGYKHSLLVTTEAIAVADKSEGLKYTFLRVAKAGHDGKGGVFALVHETPEEIATKVNAAIHKFQNR